MNPIIKIISTIFCLALLLFSVFGFLATFEPLDKNTQILFRIIYGTSGFGSLLTILFIYLKPNNKLVKSAA